MPPAAVRFPPPKPKTTLNVVQRASQTSAAAAVNKPAIRLSAGSDRLAQLVRKDQDLAAEFGKVVEGNSRMRF
jgi:hypothetical protein